MRILLITIYLLSSILVKSQSIFPIYEDQPVWCVKQTDFFFNDLEFHYNLKLLPDTMICEKSYTPILAKDYIQGQIGNRDTFDLVVGYIRQEAQKVYQLLDSCQEFLLNDFSLEIGDTIVQNYKNQEFRTVIQDTQYQNIHGITRKAYSVIYWSAVKFGIGLWIEGLGDALFPLIDLDCLSNEACEGAIGGRIVCVTQGNNTIYGTCTEPCNIPDRTTSANSLIDSQVYLQVVNNPLALQQKLEVQYQFAEAMQGKLLIVNSLGSILHKQATSYAAEEGRIILDWSPRTAGIYGLIWQSETGQRQAIQFVVQ